jgi:C-terminal processing protease CtpA/Prc
VANDLKQEKVKMRITHVSAVVLSALALLIAGQSAVGQAVMQSMEGEGFFIIQEIGALLMQKEDTLRVDFLPPVETRPKDYASVDLKVGDVILMLNGKKVADAKQIEKLYKEIKSGEEVSLGIRRDGGLRMVRFTRADESKLPKRQMMIMRNDGPGGDNEVQVQTSEGMKTFSGEGVSILPMTGLVIGLKNKQITVVGVLPMAAEMISGGGAKEGDVIVTANGTEFESTDKLVAFIDGLADGTKVEMVLRRDGKMATVSFVKTEGNVRKIIKGD